MTKDTVNMNVSSSHPGTVWVSKKLLRDMPGMQSKHVQPQLGTGSIALILDHVIPLYRRENSLKQYPQQRIWPLRHMEVGGRTKAVPWYKRDFLSLCPPGSCMHHISGWGYGSDIIVAGGRVRTQGISLSPGTICNLSIAGFYCNDGWLSSWLAGYGTWRGSFALFLTTCISLCLC